MSGEKPSVDPEDTPLVRQILYTNDVSRILCAVVSGLMTVAEPERVRTALQRLLDDWDMHVEVHLGLKQAIGRLETPKGDEN